MQKNLILKIDFDFNIELKKATPYILDILKKENVKAVFLIVMGFDTLLEHYRKFKHKGYIKRVSTLKPIKILKHFGISPFLRGLILPRYKVGPAYPDILKKIIDEGHEVGVHGYNHAFWAANIWKMEEEKIKEQIALATEEYFKIFHKPPTIWSSPNWRSNELQFKILKKYGYKYSTDGRGNYPAIPTPNKDNFIPNLPTNMPCLHELVQLGIRKDKAIDATASCLSNNYNMINLHGYYEGMLHKDLLIQLIKKLKENNVLFTTISDYMKNIKISDLPKINLERIALQGGIGEITCHDEFIKNNYFDKIKKYEIR